MAKKKDTSADDKIVGFEYQFYLFFLALVKLDFNEEVGFEVFDDVHIRFGDGTTLLIQAKHSIKGGTENITSRDIDLWKSISNWIDLINASGNGNSFIETHSFRLVTNKRIDNDVVESFRQLCAGTKSLTEIHKEITKLKKLTTKSTTNEKLHTYMQSFLSLDKKLLKLFINKIEFVHEFDNLIEEIKRQLSKCVRENKSRIQTVYDSLNSNLRDRNFQLIRERKKITYSFDSFNSEFKSCFSAGLQYELPIVDIEAILPSNLKNQVFIKQLVDIDVLDNTDVDDIVEFSTLKLLFINHLNYWIEHGLITPKKKSEIISEFEQIWRAKFDEIYRQIKLKVRNGESISSLQNEIIIAGQECFDSLRNSRHYIDTQLLPIDIATGQLYYLSDVPLIGWHFDWKNKYKK